MRNYLFALLTLALFSCKKDSDLEDSRFDCKDWKVTLIDFQGNIVGNIDKKSYKNSKYFEEGQSYCEFLERWMASEASLVRY